MRRWSRGRRAGAPNPPARAYFLRGFQKGFAQGFVIGSVLVAAAYVVSVVVGGWVA